MSSGDLDAGVKAKMTDVLSLAGTSVTWTAATATIKYLDMGLPVTCVTTGLTLGANSANPAPEHTMCSP